MVKDRRRVDTVGANTLYNPILIFSSMLIHWPTFIFLVSKAMHIMLNQ